MALLVQLVPARGWLEMVLVKFAWIVVRRRGAAKA